MLLCDDPAIQKKDGACIRLIFIALDSLSADASADKRSANAGIRNR